MAEELSAVQEHQSTTTTASASPPSSEKPSPPPPPPPTAESDPDSKTPPSSDPNPSDDLKITQTVSFKEESNIVADLPDSQKKALSDLKSLLSEALSKNEFSPPPIKEEKHDEEESKLTAEEKSPETEEKSQSEQTTVEEEAPVETAVDEDGAKTVEAIEATVVSVLPVPPVLPVLPVESVTIWGIPLVEDERSDVVLLKFLRARDFKAKEAFTMIKNTLEWRREFGIERLMEEELGEEMEEKVVFMRGMDREGHPVCYNVYGEFRRKDLYNGAFADEEKRERFLRWRIQFLEKSIRNLLDFKPGGVSTIVQVNDLRNSPGPGKWELRQATKQALHLLQDNYPEFVAKQVFVNVPWWYLAVSKLISPFITQRTKSKFVFSGPSKSTETLFKYIAPEQVPSQYGGLLLQTNGQDFTVSDPTVELALKASSAHTVEFPITEVKGVVVWEVSVVGWDVSYGAEFVPLEGYTAILQKKRRIVVGEEEVVSGSYEITAAGKVVIAVENQSSKKKKMIYRWKIKGI